MFDYGVCFGGVLWGMLSGMLPVVLRRLKLIFKGYAVMLRGALEGYASPESNIPTLHKP